MTIVVYVEYIYVTAVMILQEIKYGNTTYICKHNYLIL